MRNGLLVRVDSSHQNPPPVVDKWLIRVYNMFEEPFCVIDLSSNQLAPITIAVICPVRQFVPSLVLCSDT